MKVEQISHDDKASHPKDSRQDGHNNYAQAVIQSNLSKVFLFRPATSFDDILDWDMVGRISHLDPSSFASVNVAACADYTVNPTCGTFMLNAAQVNRRNNKKKRDFLDRSCNFILSIRT